MENDPLSSESPSAKADAAAEQQAKEKAELAKKYKAKGVQNMTLKEYLELKKKKGGKEKPQVPVPVKLTLSTPLLLICCFGVIFIPYIVYQVATGKYEPVVEKKEEKKKISYQDLMKKAAEEEESWAK
jgi:hypothetical protein